MPFIYAIRNLENNKAYIGKTAKSLAVRWANHLYEVRSGSRFFIHKAIRKYGTESFTMLPLCECAEASLDRFEKLYIALFETTNSSKGYNQTFGGEGGVPTPDVLARKSGINHANYGKPLSLETRQKIGNAKRGKPGPRKGATLTWETRLKISESRKSRTHCILGHPFSEENLKMTAQGKRQCRICMKRRSQEWRLQQRRQALLGPTGDGTVYTPVEVS